jgi:hypothetical protein
MLKFKLSKCIGVFGQYKFGVIGCNEWKTEKCHESINTAQLQTTHVIEETEKFQYLGSLVKIDGEAEENVKNRISKVNSVFSQLNNIWRAGYLSLKTKIRIFESNVKSVLLCGCETWKSTAKIKSSMQAFINR